MATLWNGASTQHLATPKDTSDIADTGVEDERLLSPDGRSPVASAPSTRPQLQRNQSAPPPVHQPPPPPSPQQPSSPSDSLSLGQLKRIVSEFPKFDPIAYAFTYADTASFEEEIEEWFSYNEAEFARLRRAKDTFTRKWGKFHAESWLEASEEVRKAFIKQEALDLQPSNLRRRCKSLQCFVHIVLGVWDETAGPAKSTQDAEAEAKSRSVATKSQLDSIKAGVSLLTASGILQAIYEVLKMALDRLWDDEFKANRFSEEDVPLLQDELDNVTTILYLFIECARDEPDRFTVVQRDLASLNPNLLDYLINATAKLRWDDGNDLPQTRIFLLLWKSLLLVFGSTSDLDGVKSTTSESLPPDGEPGDLITASPLDYHLFRQEITSKYPAYIPPQPLLPLELDSNSVLPPLPNHPIRNTGANGILPTPGNANGGGASILHQPVHIATPAPSPPPSPPVGGKAGKKQNYQTNQNFPFMYPPLDSTSNSAGGKGSAGDQERLVGRRWDGREIPASILEAGELFAKRTRMTRALRQLWDERERFLKFERGWDGKIAAEKEDDLDVEEMDLDQIFKTMLKIDRKPSVKPEIDVGPRNTQDLKTKGRLESVEAFYSAALPHLQSTVIVLLKAVLANVTALITQPMNGPTSGLGPALPSEVNVRSNVVQGQRRPGEQMIPPQQIQFDISDLSIEDLESMRSREITSKAVSGILLTLLKWFKISHILKFEYLTQLLLDSNYLPLVLKLFAHQDVDKLVDFNSDRRDLSFFSFCNSNSQKVPDAEIVPNSDDEDDAVPPPIKLRRSDTAKLGTPSSAQAATFQDNPKSARGDPPEIDELGFPVNELPSEPKTDYSWRNFFSSINYLRIMQKICKNKAHRNLLLVQYKSSNILKKALKIPQHELRLYTLKLFKNQVPYCGRKWRQGNMRVITAVYLHCRPELRDDWLAGSDVDAEVEEALPLEQALRALTHWHNVKRYPDQMGADVAVLDAEHDFFVRELEKMDFGPEDGLDSESVAESGWEEQSNGW